jgi:hypothetical protein
MSYFYSLLRQDLPQYDISYLRGKQDLQDYFLFHQFPDEIDEIPPVK